MQVDNFYMQSSGEDKLQIKFYFALTVMETSLYKNPIIYGWKVLLLLSYSNVEKSEGLDGDIIRIRVRWLGF